MSEGTRKNYRNILELSPENSIDYAARYLKFLTEQRGGYENEALWVSDYNRGLTTTTLSPSPYGESFSKERNRITQALSGQKPTTTIIDELW